MRFATAELPGLAATLGTAPEDFVVDELPLYEPSGDGPHTYLTVEKRNLSTLDAVRTLARHFQVDARDLGTAGMKDRRAVTRQHISIPNLDPARAEGLTLEAAGGSLRVLAARRHGNKLKTGHLTGNRFALTLDLPAGTDPADAAARAQATLDRLTITGVPNYYGEQRFGAAGDNAAKGREALAGRGPRDPRERRLVISALQSTLFNQVLELRLADGPPRRLLLGDLAGRPGGHRQFRVEDVAREQPRADAGEIVPTGPMFGPKMSVPTPGSPAALLEESILADAHLTLQDFARAGRLAEGTRRDLAFTVTTPTASHSAGRLHLGFSLPRGAYATIVLGELTKSQAPVRAPARGEAGSPAQSPDSDSDPEEVDAP